jgi:hypothetical protein
MQSLQLRIRLFKAQGGHSCLGPYGNDKYPEVKTQGLEETWRAMLEDKARFLYLDFEELSGFSMDSSSGSGAPPSTKQRKNRLNLNH